MSVVDTEFAALPVALRVRLPWLPKTVEKVGPEVLRARHVRHLDGKHWELRVRADDGRARRICVTAAVPWVVVLRVFDGKSRKTPRRALAAARERMGKVAIWRS